jgi:hypothetical protein
VGSPIAPGLPGWAQAKKKGNAAAFDPATYGTVVDDWDFSTLGLADGTAISTFTGSKGHALAQATGFKQPLCKTAIQNGKSVARFDGVDDFIKTSAITLNQPDTWFIVANYRAAFSATGWLFDGNTAFSHSFGRTASTTMEAFAGTALDGTSTPQSWHVYTVTFNGASSEVRVDGTVISTGNTGASNAGAVCVGAANANQPSASDAGRVIVYSGALSTANKQAVEAALKSQWGTP